MNNVENKKYWIWLSLIQGIGAKKTRILLDKYRTPENIYNQSREELMKTKGIGEKLVNNILCNNTRKIVSKHIEYMENNKIDIISIYDDNYPQLLKNIYDAPTSLYIKGNKKILNANSVAIVGCRQASEYGKKVAKYFSYNLANNNINIVSGLARGVDSYAHLGSLYVRKNQNCGKTIAVVGNGLDTIYPIENKNLVNKILDVGGAIISEYPLGTKPDKMNFPARNRIISGMSKSILVVEAKEKSGTLITVDFALEQGKDVFVVPGNINSANSVGTNELIKQGASLVTTYNDIINKIN